MAGPAHAVNSGEAHQQSSGQKQEPPEGETDEQEDFRFRLKRFSIFDVKSVWLEVLLAPFFILNKVVFLLFSLQHKTGLPISTYFSAVKLRWLLDNVDDVRQAVLSERAMFGTVDSWIIWVRAAQRLTLCTGPELRLRVKKTNGSERTLLLAWLH